MIHTDGKRTIANTPELIPGQLDLVVELAKLALPTKDELIRLSKLNYLRDLADSA